MSKSLFVDNTTNSSANQGKGIAVTKVYDVVGSKVANNDIVVLLPGDQFVEAFGGFDYVAHKVAVFNADIEPLSVELLAKSQHSFAHYGECTSEKPKVGTRTSQKGNQIPDLEMQNANSGFRFRAEVVGRENDTDLVNLIVEHLQFYKVEGFKYYWSAIYGDTQDVLVEDVSIDGEEAQVCRFKRMRKPNFMPVKFTSKQKEKVLTILREAGLIPAE